MCEKGCACRRLQQAQFCRTVLPHDGRSSSVPMWHIKGSIHSQLNWAILICDVITDEKTEWTAQFWQAITQASELSFPVVFHTENCPVHSGNPTANDSLVFIHHSHTHKKTHRTDTKLTNLAGKLCCAGEHSVQFFMQFFYTVKLHSLT